MSYPESLLRIDLLIKPDRLASGSPSFGRGSPSSFLLHFTYWEPFPKIGRYEVKYTVTAVQTKRYEIEVEAEDPAAAIALLDDWNEDDFQDYATDGHWELEAM